MQVAEAPILTDKMNLNYKFEHTLIHYTVLIYNLYSNQKLKNNNDFDSTTMQ